MARTGRPPIYSADTRAQICALMAKGNSLRSICRQDDMPDLSTVMDWLNKEPEFAERYARAVEARAEHLAEDMLAIADDGTNDRIEVGEDGETRVIVDHDHIQRSKLRVDTRKWLASKLFPRKYGDRQLVDVTGGLTLEQLVMKSFEKPEGGNDGK